MGLKDKAGLLAGSILFLALVPMWIFVLAEIRYERAAAETGARHDAMNLATAFEAHVSSMIRLMDIVLLDMREDVLEHPDTFEEHVREELEAYGSFVAQLAVIDADGKLVFSNLAPVTESVDLSDREHFQVHRDNPVQDRLFISKPVLGRISKQWTIQFTRPILDEDRFAGVLVLSVPSNFFSDYYQQIDVGKSGTIVLLGTDRSLRAIASGTPIPGRYGRFKMPEDKPYFDPDGPQYGYYTGVSAIDSEYRLGAYRRLDNEGVVVLVMLSPKDYMANFNERQEFLLVAACLVSLLLLVVAFIAFVVSRRHFRNTTLLRQAHEQVTQLLNTDVLTGASSRRAFFASLEAELARARRHGMNLSLLMLDVDHFKHVNDTYGHPVGDLVLERFAATCARLLRNHDVFGRLGGEEFAILLPHTDGEGARCVAEKIRAAVAESPVTTVEGDIAITVSIGLTALLSGQDEQQALLSRADKALYFAKQGGRNQVRAC